MAELINWSCQGILLALAAAGCSRLWRHGSAAARYRLWCAALLAILLVPALPEIAAAPAARGDSAAMTPILELPPGTPLAVPVLLAVWGGWTLASIARLAAAALAVRSMKRASTPFPASREERLHRWNDVRGSGRRARLVVSPSVRAAAVLGGRAPLIAVSPALLDNLADEDLDRIVLHEWAHVQRRDDAAQAVQQIVGAFFGLHPGVWWALRQMQLERELACDERVVELTGSARGYAASLTRLATVVRVPHVSAAIPSALGRSQLTVRVLRLLEHATAPSRPSSLAWTGAIAAVLLAALASFVRAPFVGELAPRIDAAVASLAAPPAALPLREQLPVASVILPDYSSARQRTAPAARPALQTPGAVRHRVHPVANVRPDYVPSSNISQPAPLPSRTMPAALPGPTVAILLPSVSGADNSRAGTPWSAAAGAGQSIGRETTKAARATAGFFTRLGKTIGGRF